jgi:acyl-CoA synthetase (AMP-forming)/AMP-acid ligase II
VIGRKKDLLIVGGENHNPQTIEEIVGSHRDGRWWQRDVPSRIRRARVVQQHPELTKELGQSESHDLKHRK